MGNDRDPAFEQWVQEARDTDILAYAQAQSELTSLRRAGADWQASCPVCGGKDGDELAITPKNRLFYCRKSSTGGDVIKLAQHLHGLEFVRACEAVVGRPPPGRAAQADDGPYDDSIRKERREERRDAEIQRSIQAEEELEHKLEWIMRLLGDSVPIAGTQAEAYLRQRGIFAPRELLADLRYVPALRYRGKPNNDTKEEAFLGSFPAMLAPIVDASGAVVGLHETYLDAREPIKLKPPGHWKNTAKKMLGQKLGGFIKLGPIRPAMAVGEGIETTLAWYQADAGPGDIGVAAAGDMSNMAGVSTGSFPNPSTTKSIPNGIPDLGKPGFILPDTVKEIILLGDGDSDAYWTRASMLTAARRQAHRGLTVSVHFPPKGMDWNDFIIVKNRKKGAA